MIRDINFSNEREANECRAKTTSPAPEVSSSTQTPKVSSSIRWTALHRQVCSLLELATTDVDYFLAVQRRYGSSAPPGSWEPIPTDQRVELNDVLAALKLPSSVTTLGVVTWATARRMTPEGFDETAAWIAMVTTANGAALSAAVTTDRAVAWTPYPAGGLADACRHAFATESSASPGPGLDVFGG